MQKTALGGLGGFHFGSYREDGSASVFTTGRTGPMRSHRGTAFGAGHRLNWLEGVKFACPITSVPSMSLFGEGHRKISIKKTYSQGSNTLSDREFLGKYPYPYE